MLHEGGGAGGKAPDGVELTLLSESSLDGGRIATGGGGGNGSSGGGGRRDTSPPPNGQQATFYL